MASNEPASPYALADLIRVMARLRDPQNGCPWDLKQDFFSIVPSTLEECYELVAAIEHEDYPHLAEELGDLLFQVVFYARLGEEQGLFDFGSVVQILVEKLLRRHPHVFADGKIEGVVAGSTSVEAVKVSWEEIKQRERDGRNLSAALADIPLALPALSRAQKVQKRAAGVGFDWTEIEQVVDKLREEMMEFEATLGQSDDRREDEIGDLLFTCVNLARHAGLDAESALRRATGKFESRFQAVEQQANDAGSSLKESSAAELDHYWNTAKTRE
jgi:ATP diphosphatase